MATVAELRREVELAREGLKNVDDEIKKVTGRDPSDYRPPGRRVSLKRDFNDRAGPQGPLGKRQDNTGARGRLWSRVVVSRTSQDEERPSRTRQDSDGEEEEEDSKKPTIQSSVVATRTTTPLRLKRELVVNDDAKTKSRNRRMFGMLLGTLQKFKQDSASKTEKDKRREEINKKLEEKELKEKEQVATQRRELFTTRRSKQAEIKRLEWKVELTAMQEEWDQNALSLCNAIKSKAKPSIFYLPAKHTDKTNKLLEESSRSVKRAMAKRRAEIEEELEKQEERDKSTTGEGGTITGEKEEKREHRMSEGGGDIEMGVVTQEGESEEMNHHNSDEKREDDGGDTREVILTDNKEAPMDEGEVD